MALAHWSERYQRAEREIARSTKDPVNLSVRITVADDPDHPPLWFGGIWCPRRFEYIDYAETPGVEWQIGKGQLRPFQFIQERNPDRSRMVIIGAMGAGKTEVQARISIAYAIGAEGSEHAFANCDIGMVAPIQKRLQILHSKFMRLVHPSWIEQIRAKDGEIILVNGIRYQFVAAKQQSALVGSPIQGQDWIAAFPDEEQNCTDDAMADVAMRGRAAPEGWYPVISTCTISDTAEFRARLSKYRADAQVEVHTMDATANPFVESSYWDDIKHTLTPRQYAQRVLAQECAPERATYPDFDKTLHVRPLPDLYGGRRVRDITKKITGADMLVGYDPGELVDVSVMLKAYEIANERIWYVVDELTTERTTVQQHAMELLKRLRERWRMQFYVERPNGDLSIDPTEQYCVIRTDPHGTRNDGTHVTYYREFTKLGFTIKPAQYKKTSNPQQAHLPGQLPVNARINCVNTLLMNAAHKTRLYIAADERGNAVAPKLATALEMSERDGYGRAEVYKKGAHSDQSHWPCALGYAVWPYEHARIGGIDPSLAREPNA